MIPSLIGRLQTRVFTMATVGLVWTLLYAWITPVGIVDVVIVLAAATVFGLGWELVYHAHASTRWDKDFASGLALAMGLVELVPVLALAAVIDLSLGYVAGHFLVAYLLIWLFVQGPIRVLIPRWRFRAGRIL